MYLYLLSFFMLCSGCLASLTELTPQENQAVNQRLQDFYDPELNKEVMNSPTLKYDVVTGATSHPNSHLAESPEGIKNPLLKRAGKKISKQFQKFHCEHFLKKRFPLIDCNSNFQNNGWSVNYTNDRIEDLTDGWIIPTYQLDYIPVSGKINHDAWSDDYWRTQWGQTAFRYGQGGFKLGTTYKEATAAYQSLTEWNSFRFFSPDQISEKVLSWSPAEKYDLTVGDYQFNLTQNQKQAGQYSLNSTGDVEGWMGICHGWAPAALMAARPTRPVVAKGLNNINVTWYPNDIKAMVSLSWANASYPTNFIGGRCDVKNPKTLQNGRVAQQECFDTNPATFHLALGNMIGRAQTGFIFDKSFDYEVWNQPIVAYETIYFNPLNTNQRSQNWREVAVPYDSRFKRYDRFQFPLTRGSAGSTASNPSDANIQYVVGAITSVVYLAEVRPQLTTGVQQDRYVRETYIYDLEIENHNQKWVATGGEWQQNSHPDFLWVPKKGATSATNFDRNMINVGLGLPPNNIETATAQQASQHGNPLCQVIKALIAQSTGVDSYPCQ
jgi:hypothetical protein